MGTDDGTSRRVLLLAAAHSHAMRVMFRPDGEAGVDARADMNRFLTEEEQESVKKV